MYKVYNILLIYTNIHHYVGGVETTENTVSDGVGDKGVKAVSEVISTINLDMIDWNTVNSTSLEEDQKVALETLRLEIS